MRDPEQLFENELEIFRKEAYQGAQFFYGYLAFNAVLGRNRKALHFVNRTPLLWGTHMAALQTAFFIVLGRIFDQQSNHNIDALLGIAQKHVSIFSKAALGARKLRGSPNASEWIEEYLRKCHEPRPGDFRQLRKRVRHYRRIYENSYRDIRRKYFAHKEVADPEDVQKLFSKTNVRELQKVFVFVIAVYQALWEVFHNGHKLTLRPMRYSVMSIMRKRKPEWHTKSVPELIVADTQDLFKLFLGNGRERR